MSRALLIGSNNSDKAAELRALLDGTEWEVRTLADYPECDEPEETEETFEENALLKARYYGERFGVACVADDSGLEVEALGGAPGVYSARYAGEGCSYDDNNRKLLTALDDYIVEGRRKARFVCCAAYVGEDGSEHVETGSVEGGISPMPRGNLGFGYDPIFLPHRSIRTFGEMTPEDKGKISHRGEAFRKMRAHLVALI